MLILVVNVVSMTCSATTDVMHIRLLCHHGSHLGSTVTEDYLSYKLPGQTGSGCRWKTHCGVGYHPVYFRPLLPTC